MGNENCGSKTSDEGALFPASVAQWSCLQGSNQFRTKPFSIFFYNKEPPFFWLGNHRPPRTPKRETVSYLGRRVAAASKDDRRTATAHSQRGAEAGRGRGGRDESTGCGGGRGRAARESRMTRQAGGGAEERLGGVGFVRRG